MKRLIICGFLAIPCFVSGQNGDSLQIFRPVAKEWRLTLVAVPLVAGGIVMRHYDAGFHDLRNAYAGSFHHGYDTYLQYSPAALMLGLKAFGVDGRSSWGRMLVSDAFSVVLMTAAVDGLKYSMRVMRPDGSRRNSFPSGHTATAFMAATMLHREYGARSPWYSIGGYAAATATGITRELNNRHWMSDVLVGAGIGILVTEAGYWLADLIFKDHGLNFYETRAVFDRCDSPSFVGFSLGMSVIPGIYRPYEGMRLRFEAGSTVGVQGAWFASPYVGIGGRFAVNNSTFSADGVRQNAGLDSYSAAGGAYFAYPLSPRWSVGSELLGGYAHYRTCTVGRYLLGGRGGFAFGTGLSIVCKAREHLGVRFATDYDLLPPLVRGTDSLHRITFGLEASAMF